MPRSPKLCLDEKFVRTFSWHAILWKIILKCICVLQNCVARALYDNIAESPDELAFRKGDVLTVLEQNTGGIEGWWLCSLRGRQVRQLTHRLLAFRSAATFLQALSFTCFPFILFLLQFSSTFFFLPFRFHSFPIFLLFSFIFIFLHITIAIRQAAQEMKHMGGRDFTGVDLVY